MAKGKKAQHSSEDESDVTVSDISDISVSDVSDISVSDVSDISDISEEDCRCIRFLVLFISSC